MTKSEFMALVGDRPPTADTMRALEPQLNELGVQLVWNATNERADLVLPDGTHIDAIAKQGQDGASWVWQDFGPVRDGRVEPLPGFEDQWQGTRPEGVTREEMEGAQRVEQGGEIPPWGTPYVDPDGYHRNGAPQATDSEGNPRTAVPRGSFQPGGTPIEQFAQPQIGYDPSLPPGYSTGYEFSPTTQYSAGQGQYPYASASGPGLAAPWNVGFQAPDPNQLEGLPYYEFLKDEGNDAIQRSAASKGTLLTGGTMKDLAAWNQGLASTSYGDIYNRALGEYQQAYDIFQNNNQTLYNRVGGLFGAAGGAAGNLTSANTAFANQGTQALGAIGGANAQGAIANANIWNNFGTTLGNIGTDAYGAWSTQQQQQAFPTTDPLTGQPMLPPA